MVPFLSVAVPPALEVEGLTVYQGQRVVLKDVHLSIPQGSACALVGPNGAGKSTLLKAILGLTPHRGVVRVLGQDRKQGVLGYVPQRVEGGEPFPVTVQELVRTGVPGFWPKPAQYQWALAALGISHLARHRLQDLSGGERQRVLIAHALVAKRSVLLLDEPTLGIDQVGLSNLFQLLQTLRQQEGLTLLIVSHDLEWVAHWADQVICLGQTPEGSLIVQGTPEIVLTARNLERIYRHSPDSVQA